MRYEGTIGGVERARWQPGLEVKGSAEKITSREEAEKQAEAELVAINVENARIGAFLQTVLGRGYKPRNFIEFKGGEERWNVPGRTPDEPTQQAQMLHSRDSRSFSVLKGPPGFDYKKEQQTTSYSTGFRDEDRGGSLKVKRDGQELEMRMFYNDTMGHWSPDAALQNDIVKSRMPYGVDLNGWSVYGIKNDGVHAKNLEIAKWEHKVHELRHEVWKDKKMTKYLRNLEQGARTEIDEKTRLFDLAEQAAEESGRDPWEARAQVQKGVAEDITVAGEPEARTYFDLINLAKEEWAQAHFDDGAPFPAEWDPGERPAETVISFDEYVKLLRAARSEVESVHDLIAHRVDEQESADTRKFN